MLDPWAEGGRILNGKLTVGSKWAIAQHLCRQCWLEKVLLNRTSCHMALKGRSLIISVS